MTDIDAPIPDGVDPFCCMRSRARDLQRELFTENVRRQKAEAKVTAQKTALTKASASLSAFLGFHAEGLPLEAVRGLSELLKEIQPLIKP